MKKLLTGIILVVVASFAKAESLDTNGFSYDYVQAIYAYSSYKDTLSGYSVSADIKGYDLQISKAINQDFYMTVEYVKLTSNSLKIAGTSYDIDLTNTGSKISVGYRMPINEKTDFNLEAGYGSSKSSATYSGTTYESNEKTYPVTVRIRYKLATTVEFEGGYTRSGTDDNGYLGIGLEITKGLALVGAIAPETKGDVYQIGLRYNY